MKTDLARKWRRNAAYMLLPAVLAVFSSCATRGAATGKGMEPAEIVKARINSSSYYYYISAELNIRGNKIEKRSRIIAR